LRNKFFLAVLINRDWIAEDVINRDFQGVSSTCSCGSWLHRPNIGYWLEISSGKSSGNRDMEQVLQLAVLVFAALATGGLMVNWIGLGRAMSRLSVSTYVEFHQATNHTFDPYMPIVVVGALLGGIVLAILSQGIHSLSGELAIAGSVCYAAVLAIALSTNVRINKQIARWSVQSPPDDWTAIRASWVRFHIARTLFSLPGLACYILACLVGR
jgi:uncharacterized membrane protein